MKKALIAVGAVVAAFAAGLAGVYFAMPTLSPETVERAQAHVDSLVSLTSLAVADSPGLSVDSPNRSPDSLAATRPPDSLMAMQPDSLMAMQPDSLADAGSAPSTPNPADVASLEKVPEGATTQDSLAALQRSVEGLLQEKEALLDQIQVLQGQFETRQTQQAEAQELSATLAKLEDKELAGIVEQLDMAVLEILYKQASARNRARLLQAMPPQVAASFVHSLMQPGRAGVTEVARPDTVPSPQVSDSEPAPLNK